MPTSKEYFKFILDKLSGLCDVTYRQMMREYIIYYKGKIIGGIYDNRFLVKPIKSAKELMPDASLEIPYDGAKAMLLIDNVDDKEIMKELFIKMYNELPEPRKRKKQ